MWFSYSYFQPCTSQTGQVTEDPCMPDFSKRHLPFLDWLSFYYSKWGTIEQIWILCYKNILIHKGSNLRHDRIMRQLYFTKSPFFLGLAMTFHRARNFMVEKILHGLILPHIKNMLWIFLGSCLFSVDIPLFLRIFISINLIIDILTKIHKT